MSLYQISVLKNYINLQEKEAVEKAYKKYVKYFLNPTIQENIRSSKEEEYQGIFLTELFVNILGYTLKPKADFNLVAEYKNQTNSRKADGAILHKDIAVGVIELKGTKTKDLESIRKQAFDYKANQKGCVYVITSNFEKLRFYINDATEFEEFNLFELTKERFQLFYLCLQKDNIINNVPLKIKEASIVQEEKITKEFYKDYSLFKRELYRDLVKQNAKRLKTESSLRAIAKQSSEEQTAQQKVETLQLEKNVKLALFKKSQKLIDRFLFIFFAEDRGLLPANSTELILEKWKADNDFGDERPLYSLFKQYFKFLDQGRQGTKSRGEIYAYNGGLFKEDALLDGLLIDNDLLYKHTHKLAAYDFESQVDVNILGHIFENSLNEIESVNAEIEGDNFDKQTSKRKKDGVFYTPKYITKYIVENTVGKLCEEKKAALGIKEEEYFKGRKNRNKTTITKLVDLLDTYRDWLLQLTICDPACGSGAFLNQALDFLIKEHTYIDELKTKVLGGGLQFSDIENTILENNIFGVDLNEESVEIAKLSLWLRTAQPRRKLNDLSSNIKCGNSLIHSKAVAGDKAFHWETQFPQVFKNGGFDVIIGNPPYVQHRNLIQFSEFFKAIYEVYTGTSDLSVYFYEKGLSILKEKGMFAFINTNKFFNSEYGKKLRDFLVNFDIVKILNFEQVSIFKGALVSSTINIIRKTQSENDTVYIEFKKEKLEIESFETEILKRKRHVTKEYLRKNSWIFENKMIGDIIDKIKSKGKFLGEIEGVNIKRGITTGFDDAFVLQRSNSLNKNYSEISKKLLRGRDIGRYWLNDSDLNLLFIPWHFPLNDDSSISGASVIAEESMKEGYLQLYNHLSSFKEKLSLRNKKETGVRYEWYVLQRCAASYYELFDRNKIVWGLITGNWGFSLDTEKHYLTSSSFFLTSEKINLQLLLLLLNSSLYKFYFENVGELTAGGAYVLKKASVEKFVYPTKVSEKSTIDFLSKAVVLNGLNFEFKACVGKFEKYLHQIFKLEKLSKKLQNWHDLEFGDFIKELNKAIKTSNKQRLKNNLQEVRALTKKDEFEWLDLFEENKQKAQSLQTQITQTDKEIDAMVYELYGLTEDEIQIVENS
jgi:hypothetical protein